VPDRPRPPRVIPNYNMDKPWSAPLEPGEADMIAESALLSGAGDSEAQIQAVLSEFAGQYVQNLRGAKA